MHYTNALLGVPALLSGFAHGLVPPIPGVPALPAVPVVPALGAVKPASFDLHKSVEDEILYAGGISASLDASAELGLALSVAEISGSVSVALSEKFTLDSILRLDLSDVEAHIQIALQAGIAISESVELCASSKLSIDVPGLLDVDIGAAFALDLLIQVSAAIDISAGVYVKFPKGSYIDINILTKEIISSKIDGLLSEALPIAIGADIDISAEVTVKIGLRLRAEIGIDVDVNLPGLPIGVGADICLWVSLFDYTSVIIGGKKGCIVAVKEVIAFSLGLLIDVDVSIGKLELDIAPTVVVTLAKTIEKELCLPGHGDYPHVPGLPCKSKKCHGDHDDDEDEGGKPGKPPGDYVTRTETETKTYTITSCAASVPHCPASHTQKVITSTVLTTTTVCPATETEKPTKPTKKPHHGHPKPTKPAPVPTCKETHTWKPTGEHPAPTVTITDSTTTTVCTETTDYPTKPTHPTKPCEEDECEAPEKPEKPSKPTGGYEPAPSKPTGSAKPVAPCPTCKPVTAGAGKAVAALGAVVPALFALL